MSSTTGFCSNPVPPPRGAFGGLAPQTRIQAPRIETLNHINQLRFCQFLECQVPLHKPKAPQKRKAPLLKTFRRRFCSKVGGIFGMRKARKRREKRSEMWDSFNLCEMWDSLIYSFNLPLIESRKRSCQQSSVNGIAGWSLNYKRCWALNFKHRNLCLMFRRHFIASMI